MAMVDWTGRVMGVEGRAVERAAYRGTAGAVGAAVIAAVPWVATEVVVPWAATVVAAVVLVMMEAMEAMEADEGGDIAH